jgi:hypothetical protein
MTGISGIIAANHISKSGTGLKEHRLYRHIQPVEDLSRELLECPIILEGGKNRNSLSCWLMKPNGR